MTLHFYILKPTVYIQTLSLQAHTMLIKKYHRQIKALFNRIPKFKSGFRGNFPVLATTHFRLTRNVWFARAEGRSHHSRRAGYNQYQ